MKNKFKKIFLLENLVYGVILLLPLYLVKIKFLFWPSNWLEILIGLTLIGWWFKKRKNFNLKFFLKNYQKYIIAISLIAGGFFLSVWASNDAIKSLGAIKGWFLAPLLFILIAGDIIGKKKIKNIFQAYFFSAFIVSIIALGYLILQKLTYDRRLEAFFNSPNYLAMYLAPALAGIIIKLILETKRKNKLMSIYLIVPILVAFYWTFSYSAWLAVGLAILAVLTLKFKHNKKKIVASIIIILAGFLLIFSSQLNNKKFIALVDFNNRSSVASRVIIWRVTWRAIEDHWFLGIGMNNFQTTYLSYQKEFPPYLEWAVPHPHNLYLAFWLSGGILSLIGFFMFLFFWFQNIFQKLKKDNQILFWMTLGLMLVILFHGFVDTTYFKNDLAIIFWMNLLVCIK